MGGAAGVVESRASSTREMLDARRVLSKEPGYFSPHCRLPGGARHFPLSIRYRQGVSLIVNRGYVP